MMQLAVETADGPFQIDFLARQLIIAGWTGRDEKVLEAHIEELAALGVARPKSVPIFYRADAALLSTSDHIQVVGMDGSGEVEAVLLKYADELYVTVGSDHTDRKLETVGITLSKQVCAKPIATTVWRWRDVAEHWDEITLRSTLPSEAEIYQEGSTRNLRSPADLLALYETAYGIVPDGAVMFCGTLPVRGGIRFSDRMKLELVDRVRNVSIAHSYSVEVLPVAEA